MGVAQIIAAILIGFSLAPTGATAQAAPPGLETMVGCVFGMQGEDVAARRGFALFLPASGEGRHPMAADQTFDPDAVLGGHAFTRVDVVRGTSTFDGARRLTLTFLGGEVYEGVLEGAVSPAWCVASREGDREAAFVRFAQLLDGLRKPAAASEPNQ